MKNPYVELYEKLKNGNGEIVIDGITFIATSWTVEFNSHGEPVGFHFKHLEAK